MNTQVQETIYRQELEVVYTTPECNRRIEEFKKLSVKELFEKLHQAERNLERLRRIAGNLHAVDRMTAYHAIGEVLQMEYYRVENLEKAILEPRLLFENKNGDSTYCGQTDAGQAYSIDVKGCDAPNVLDNEVILHQQNEPSMTLYVDWPEIPETQVLRCIKWLELA